MRETAKLHIPKNNLSFLYFFFLHVAFLQTCLVQGHMSAEMSAQIDWFVSSIKGVGRFTFPSHPLLIRKAVRYVMFGYKS